MESEPIIGSNVPRGFPRLPIRIQSFSEFYMIRDDLLPFGFGTKWRKTIGIVREATHNRVKRILLWGAIHGNYLASFTYILRSFGFSVETISYSKDPNLKTYNERLVTHHSNANHRYANRSLAFSVFQERSKRFDGLLLPEFGIHPGQIQGLFALWEELENIIRKKLGISFLNRSPFEKIAILLVEIGSGVSFLSAYDYFFHSPILVQGVMVGESKETWFAKLTNLQEALGLTKRQIPLENLIEINEEEFKMFRKNNLSDPHIDAKQKGTRFARRHQKQSDWIRTFYENSNVILEPIYSAKTICHLLTSQRESKLDVPKIPTFYLHQGGQIQHMDLVFPRPFPK